MNDCRFGVSQVNYPDPDPCQTEVKPQLYNSFTDTDDFLTQFSVVTTKRYISRVV